MVMSQKAQQAKECTMTNNTLQGKNSAAQNRQKKQSCTKWSNSSDLQNTIGLNDEHIHLDEDFLKEAGYQTLCAM